MNRMRWLTCGLIAALLLLCTALPAMAATTSIPKPGKEFYFLDQANVLSEATEGEIFFSNEKLYAACGAQIVVVTVKTTGSTPIDDYALELFNRWGIGRKDTGNGFLLLMAIDDDEYYALCGDDLQPKFTSGQLKQYFNDYLETDFAAKRYDAGARKFYEAVFKRVSDTYSADVDVSHRTAICRGGL